MVCTDLVSVFPTTEQAECLALDLNEQMKEVENLFAQALPCARHPPLAHSSTSFPVSVQMFLPSSPA